MWCELDEQTLIQSARHGDLDAFNLLIPSYQDLLFGIAVRILGDEEGAADAVQIALISAFRKFNNFRCGSLRGWLARIVVNACYDEIRRRHRRREVPLLGINVEGEEIEVGCWLVDPAPRPEERLETEEFKIILQKCLSSLAPIYRSVLVLVDIEGLTYEEAAVVGGVPIGTVRSRLARARLQMRRALQPFGEFLPARYRMDLSLEAEGGCSYRNTRKF